MDFSNSDVLIKIVRVVLAILIPTLVYLCIKGYISRRTKKMKKGKKITYFKLFASIVKYLAIIVSILTILQIFGVDTGSILAGLGIASVIAGLALQDALKDIIMGFNIIADNYFTVGDVVKINGITGKVLEIGFKATKIQNIVNQNIEVIANRNITTSTVVSHQLDIDLPLPYDKTLTESENFIKNVLEKIAKLEHVESASYIGIQEYSDSSVSYRLRFMVKPEFQLQFSRDVRCLIKETLDNSDMEIPYPQLDIHNKK